MYFLVRTMGASRLQAWLSAVGSALVSPSFLFIKEMRYDASYLMPARLGVLIRYGEGPHISSLSLLPFALAFAFLGIRRRSPGALALAAVFCALVTLTNFYGATALAVFYPILVWSVWVTYRERAIWLRALIIPALAYALTAFWLTPSYFRITLYNLRYVSPPGNRFFRTTYNCRRAIVYRDFSPVGEQKARTCLRSVHYRKSSVFLAERSWPLLFQFPDSGRTGSPCSRTGHGGDPGWR